MSTYGWLDARALAQRAHEGQVDKGGADYFEAHLVAVEQIVRAEFGGNMTDSIVAILHDVVEDTYVTLEDITEMFGAEIAADIDALSRREGESYNEYIERLITYGGRAVFVKRADVLDHIRRAENISASLLKRYEGTLAKLEA